MTVSYTHLRAHETDSYLIRRQRQMCIRDSIQRQCRTMSALPPIATIRGGELSSMRQDDTPAYNDCLLYTSPSPRDGLLSNSSAASDVYKRQHSAPVPNDVRFASDSDHSRWGAKLHATGRYASL